MRELERQMATIRRVLRDPERNIQIGCWYLEKIYEQFQDAPEAETRWSPLTTPDQAARSSGVVPIQPGNTQSGAEFINRIDIPSTKAYVISIMQRYRQVKSAKTRAPLCRSLQPQNDDYLFGALGRSRFGCTDRERRRGGSGTTHRRRWSRAEIVERFPEFKVESFGEAIILPGLVNTSHASRTHRDARLSRKRGD
jgi:hypothetical protein